MKSWASSTDELTFKDLETRRCQSEDFELTDSNPNGYKMSSYGFHQMDESTKNIVEGSDYQLLCMKDLDAIRIKGDFNTNAADNLMVVYEVCDPANPARTGATKCKSEETIKAAINGAYLLLIENIERYKHQYSPSSDQMFKRET